MEQLLDIRGKRLHVEVIGPDDAPVLFFLHGGPGGHGAYEYMHFQREHLSKHLRVVALDQRGTLRSDALTDEDTLVLQDLIDDCEAVRNALGISRWSVLGHSFGGYLATRYVLEHPDAVQCLVLEAPSFDLSLTFRSNLRATSREFAKMGEPEKAARSLAYAEADLPVQELMERCGEMQGQLGDNIKNLYIYGEDKDFISKAMQHSPLPKEHWERAGKQGEKLFAEGRLLESLLPRLAEIRVPALLLRSELDPICCDVQAQAFADKVPNGHSAPLFTKSGHCLYAEEPDAYADLVIRFVLEHSN